MIGSPGRPAHRPGVPAAVVATLLATTACQRTPPVPEVASPPVPDVVAPAWRQPGDLDIRFTVDKPRAPGGARTFHVHAVLTVDDAGRVRAMRTAQSGDGVVALRTDWDGGPTTVTTRAPGCAAASEPAEPPESVAGWLAEPFGPVDATTVTGWTVAGGTATRPGSTAETLEQASLTELADRVVREVDRSSGAVVTEVHDITIGPAVRTPSPAACGAPWPDAVPGSPAAGS